MFFSGATVLRPRAKRVYSCTLCQSRRVKGVWQLVGIYGTDYTADGTLKRESESSVFRAVDSEDDFVLAVFFKNPFDLLHGALTLLLNFGVAVDNWEIRFFCAWIFI